MTANPKPNSAQAALDALAAALNPTDYTTTLTVEPDDGSGRPGRGDERAHVPARRHRRSTSSSRYRPGTVTSS
jgi:hypothetical protein